MTLTQIEYLLALDKHRHYVKAAEACGVTQPTLSMQISKLEKELEVTLFDRSKQPLVPTEEGKQLVEQARNVVYEAEKLRQMAEEQHSGFAGELSLGVIPTVAPYLLPTFIGEYAAAYPDVRLDVREMSTDQIVRALEQDELDCALLATPLDRPKLTERALYYEPFVAFMAEAHPLLRHKQLETEMVANEPIHLLDDTHCFRLQVDNLCKTRPDSARSVRYQSGSVETLKKLVEMAGGLTLLPELSTYDLPEEQYDRIRYFSAPEPTREISMVVHRRSLRQRLVDTISSAVLQRVPAKMRTDEGKSVVRIYDR